MNNKNKKEANGQGKILKTIRKNQIDKTKEKEGFSREPGVFSPGQVMLYAIQVCDTRMYKSSLFKTGKNIPYFLYVFVHFCPFSLFLPFFFSIVVPFPEKSESCFYALEYELHCHRY